jgi:imidazoleglycerol-phosphate dehydratase
MTMRKARVKRQTKETDISIGVNLDGTGLYQVKTPFPFMDHMLSAFSKHGFFDLDVKAKGDTEIDDHHTMEDIGIVMGEVLAKAVGKKEGIRRFGNAVIPLDEALAQVTVDLSGRPYLVYEVRMPRKKIKAFDVEMVEHFFRSLVDQSRMNLHIRLISGKDPHHILEAIFKGFGRALDQALQIDPRVKGVASTKGKL